MFVGIGNRGRFIMKEFIVEEKSKKNTFIPGSELKLQLF